MLTIGPDRLAKLAAKAFTPKQTPVLSIAHIHQMRVSVKEHAELLRARLQFMEEASFETLVSDCANTLEVVARFLALLELFREGLVVFTQVQALGELVVRWTGSDDTPDLDIDEYEDDVAAEATDE